MLFEQPAEIQRIVVSDNVCDFGNVVCGLFQQVLCVCHTKGLDILGRCYAGILFESTGKPGCAEVVLVSIFLDADGLAVVFVEIRNSSYNVIVYGAGIVPGFLQIS